MRFSPLYLWLAAAILIPSEGAATSFFLSPEEEGRVDAYWATIAPPAQSAKNTLRLDSLLYFGPGAWTAWINGRKWTPEMRHPALKILDVGPDEIVVSWMPDGAKKSAKPVTLHPHETYAAESAEETIEEPVESDGIYLSETEEEESSESSRF